MEVRMLTAHDIQYVVSVHTNFPRKASKAFRKFDGKTPYWVHPVWCATAILAETHLEESLREAGALALLYHDVLEDTTGTLPVHLSRQVIAYIHEMTYGGGFAEEVVRVWESGPEVRLFKLFDKVHNLSDGSWMTSEKHEIYAAFTMQLADDVEKNFGVLSIVRMARALCANSGS